MRWLMLITFALGSTPALPAAAVDEVPSGSASTGRCGKDTDCKGDRVCDAGACREPRPPAGGEATPSGAVAQSPIPVCSAGDGKTRIAVWTPNVNAGNDTDQQPPQHDGGIVRIRLAVDAGECNDDTLHTVNIPNRDGQPGGLAVNIKGNARYANGRCVLSGYYMNEDVAGMHQGWLETYFGVIDNQKIVLSGKFCLARDID